MYHSSAYQTMVMYEDEINQKLFIAINLKCAVADLSFLKNKLIKFNMIIY